MQPTKYANAALSGDKVLAIPPNSCVEPAAKRLLIVKHKQALQSILIVILTPGFVIRLDVLFKVTMLTRGRVWARACGSEGVVCSDLPKVDTDSL